MHITEIFKIWTQVAIDSTVSGLNRLFYSLQTRRGGGCRSRSASCITKYFEGVHWCPCGQDDDESNMLFEVIPYFILRKSSPVHQYG